MKKKNLFQTVLFIIAFVMMNQFANAQSCKNGHPCPSGKICLNGKCVTGPTRCCSTCGANWACLLWCRQCRLSKDGESTVTDETSLIAIYPNPISNFATI